METYKTIEEKEAFFKSGGMKIDNDKDFNEYSHILQIQYSKEDFIFRGVSEAKYKMFSSAQRLWYFITNKNDLTDEEKYDNYIINLMSECKKWNLGTIPNLLNTYGIKDNNSIAYLSFMQHFGMPTPLIDFTKNPNKAWYFATESIPDNYAESENEIDNYFSVYFTYQENISYQIFKQTFNKNRDNKKDGEFDYEDLTKNGIVLISDRDEEFNIVNNIRIANQEGLFFYNNSPNLPIEEQYKMFADMLLKEIGQKKFDEMLAHQTFSGCYNFHKKYAKHVREILKGMPINKEYIYPNIDDLIKHIDNISRKY